MKVLILILAISTFNFGLIAENLNQREYWENSPYDTIALSEIYYLKVSLETSKSELLLHLGEPDSIVNPKYDCGGFSEYWQEKIFYQFFYKSLNFIGSEQEFVIERIDFTSDTTLVLEYRGHKLSYLTELNEFKELFPKSFDNKTIDPENNQILIYLLPTLITEDMIIVTFENGHMTELKYFTPC